MILEWRTTQLRIDETPGLIAVIPNATYRMTPTPAGTHAWRLDIHQGQNLVTFRHNEAKRLYDVAQKHAEAYDTR